MRLGNWVKLATSGYFFTTVSALGAFILWGGWALYMNLEYGMFVAMQAGATQGMASSLLTLFMVRAVSWIYTLCGPSKIRLVLPAITTVFFTGSCIFLIHWLMGTPRIIATIVPAIGVAFLFCLFTTYQLTLKASENT